MNCIICTERYRAGEYCPRILPCSHTFCSMCISKLLNLQKKKKKRKKSCPFCRQEYEAKLVTDLIINRDLLELSEKRKDLARRNPLSYPVWKETVWRGIVDYHLNESCTTKNRIKETINGNVNTIKDLMNNIVCFKDLIPRTVKHFLSWLDFLEEAIEVANWIIDESGNLMSTKGNGWIDGEVCSNASFEDVTSVTREKLLRRYVVIEEAPNFLSKVMNFVNFLDASSEKTPSVSGEATNDVVDNDVVHNDVAYNDEYDEEEGDDDIVDEVREGRLLREMQMPERYNPFHQLARIPNPSIPICERCKVQIGEQDRIYFKDTPFMKMNILLCIKCCVYWIDKGLIVIKELNMGPRKTSLPYLQMKNTSFSRGFTPENVNYYLEVLDCLFFKNVALKESLQYHFTFLKGHCLQRMRDIMSLHVGLVKHLEAVNEDLEITLEKLDREENKLEEINAQLEDSSNFSSAASVMKSVENVIESFVTLVKKSSDTLSKNNIGMRKMKKTLENLNRDKLYALRQSFIKVEENVERKLNEISAW